jgi:thiol-disulfide isomerase/thioredoxin
MTKKNTLIAATLIILSTAVLTACGTDTKVDTKYDALAQCLTEKGVVFYGAYWCPHCLDQKKMFGDSMKYVNYVECDARGENAKPEECQKAGVENYPTWTFPGQEKLKGAHPLEELAKKANCESALLVTGEETQQTAQVSQQPAQP